MINEDRTIEGASQVALVVKNLPAKADVRDAVSIHGRSGRSPGGRPGNPLQYSCLEEVLATHSSILAWRIPWTEEPGGATVQRVTKSQTGLK